MNTTRTLTSGLASISALILLVIGASVPTAQAVSGRNMDRTEDTVAVQSEDGTGSGDDMSEDTQVEKRIEAAREKAKANLEDVREKKTAQTAQKRQLVCEKRQNAINNKVRAFTKAADTQMAHLDGAYTKLKAYQTTNNVQVANFADLTAAADAKQAAAVAAVTALKQVATDVDCTNPDVAVTLGTVKQAGQTTRQALRDYRAALHDILVALAQAKEVAETTDTSTDGGTE